MSNHDATGRPIINHKKCSRAKGRDCWYWFGKTHLGFNCCQYILCTGKSNGYAKHPERKKKDEPPCRHYTKPRKHPPRQLVNDFRHDAAWYKERENDTTN